MALAAQVKRPAAFGKAEEPENTQPASDRSRIADSTVASRFHHEGYVLDREWPATCVGKLEGPEPQGFRVAGHDHTRRHGCPCRRLRERLRDQAEHLCPEPLTYLSDYPRLVLGVPVGRGERRDVALQISERLVLPATLIDPHLMVGDERPGRVSQHPTPSGRPLIAVHFELQHTPHDHPHAVTHRAHP